MLVISDEVGSGLDFGLLDRILRSKIEREVELVVCDDEQIAFYNAKYRGKDRATDVLSFPYEDMGFGIEDMQTPLGCLMISFDHVQQGASDHGHALQDELALLFIHGLLHLMGYDHEVDDGEMRALEIEMIEAFDLPDSLIVRADSGL